MGRVGLLATERTRRDATRGASARATWALKTGPACWPAYMHEARSLPPSLSLSTTVPVESLALCCIVCLLRHARQARGLRAHESRRDTAHDAHALRPLRRPRRRVRAARVRCAWAHATGYSFC